ncbi:hypothetical protein [Aurantivibrio plasticivorans]
MKRSLKRTASALTHLIALLSLAMLPFQLLANQDTTMHTTVIVNFPLGADTTVEQAKALYEASVPMYKDLPGLIRKYYLFGEGGIGGGVYLWESREAAEAVYTDEWKKGLTERLGAEPTVTYFSSPVIIDNAQ